MSILELVTEQISWAKLRRGATASQPVIPNSAHLHHAEGKLHGLVAA